MLTCTCQTAEVIYTRVIICFNETDFFFKKKGHLRLFNHDKSLPLEVNASCTAIHPAFEIHKNSDIIVFLQYYHSFTVGGHCKFG